MFLMCALNYNDDDDFPPEAMQEDAILMKNGKFLRYVYHFDASICQSPWV
jgi:hypothetical protein